MSGKQSPPPPPPEYQNKRSQRMMTGGTRDLIGEHFCSPGHDFISHASVCCLNINPKWTDNDRKRCESYWIHRLNTLNPSGINRRD